MLFAIDAHIWHGKANRLSRDEPVQWEILDQVEVASWKSSTEQKVVELNHDDPLAERVNPMRTRLYPVSRAPDR